MERGWNRYNLWQEEWRGGGEVYLVTNGGGCKIYWKKCNIIYGPKFIGYWLVIKLNKQILIFSQNCEICVQTLSKYFFMKKSNPYWYTKNPLLSSLIKSSLSNLNLSDIHSSTWMFRTTTSTTEEIVKKIHNVVFNNNQYKTRKLLGIPKPQQTAYSTFYTTF